eukprot:SAG11_NODE_1186_length_5590_cov_2.852850_6_plen_101_part_00
MLSLDNERCADMPSTRWGAGRRAAPETFRITTIRQTMPSGIPLLPSQKARIAFITAPPVSWSATLRCDTASHQMIDHPQVVVLRQRCARPWKRADSEVFD